MKTINVIIIDLNADDVPPQVISYPRDTEGIEKAKQKFIEKVKEQTNIEFEIDEALNSYTYMDDNLHKKQIYLVNSVNA